MGEVDVGVEVGGGGGWGGHVGGWMLVGGKDGLAVLIRGGGGLPWVVDGWRCGDDELEVVRGDRVELGVKRCSQRGA